MFTSGETSRELGGDYFQRRDPERATKRVVSKLQELGHAVTHQPAAARSNRHFPSTNSSRSPSITPPSRLMGNDVGVKRRLG